MTEPEEIPWKRLTAEVVAIVGSILLAFAIDALWQESLEDRREHEVLVALLDDFEKSKSNIVFGRNFHLGVQQSNIKLLSSVTSSEVTLSNDEVERLLADLTWWDSTTRFSSGALNSLVFGNDLSIIEDDVLRRLLAEWPSQIERTESLLRQDYDLFVSVILPFLRANSYLPKLATLGTPMPGDSSRSSPMELPLEGNWDHSTMVETEEFQNILVQKYWVQNDVLSEFERIEMLLGETIDRIKISL